MRFVIHGHGALFSGVEIHERDDAAVKAHEFPDAHLVHRQPENRIRSDRGAKLFLVFTDEIEMSAARKNGIHAGFVLFGYVFEQRE